jgi:hypothetical protein
MEVSCRAQMQGISDLLFAVRLSLFTACPC